VLRRFDWLLLVFPAFLAVGMFSLSQLQQRPSSSSFVTWSITDQFVEFWLDLHYIVLIQPVWDN